MTSILSHVEGDSARILQLMVAVPGTVAQEELQKALLLAVQLGHQECVKVLLQAEADPNVEVTPGNTAVSVAAERGRTEILKDLIKAGGNVNCQLGGKGNALHMATRQGNTSVADVLLQAGVNPDAKDRSGNTPLVLAAKKGGASLPVIRCLAAGKCDLNLCDSDGRTALHFCAQKGTVVEVLLEAGANPDVQDIDGNTAMHLAATEGFDKIISSLLRHKADPDITNSFGRTTLHYLGMKNHHEAIENIARYHGCLDIVDSSGKTPLYYAVEHNRPQAVKALLRCNCRADPPGHPERSLADLDNIPLQSALQKGYYGLAKLIVLAGSDLCPLHAWMERVVTEQVEEEAERQESQRLLFPAQHQQQEEEREDDADLHLEKKDAIAWFSDWLNSPHTLQQLCRIEIRQVLRRSFLFDKSCLNLPPAIMNYVTLKEVEDHHIVGFQGFVR